MKRTKICVLALGAVMALCSFTGCGKETKTSESSSDTTPSETLEHIEVTGGSGDPAQPEAVVVPDEYMAKSEQAIDEVVTETFMLNDEAQEYCNTYVSNFAETYFSDYDKGYSSTDQLLDVAYIHIKINSPDSMSTVKKGDLTYEVFTSEKAVNVVNKYFSIYFTEDECKTLAAPPSTYGDMAAGPYYEDGKIWYQSASGENYSRIAIVDTVDNNMDGTLTLKFTIYSVDTNSGLKAYYKMTPEKARSDNTLTKVTSGAAVVDVGQSGQYYLISYKTLR